METPETGRATVEASIENLEDRWAVQRGLLQPEKVRSETVPERTGRRWRPDALLARRGDRPAWPSEDGGKRMHIAPMDEAVRLTIKDRDSAVDVFGVDDDVPPLIGQISLEFLDFVVDPQS